METKTKEKRFVDNLGWQLKRIENDLNTIIIEMANGKKRLESQHDLEITLKEVRQLRTNQLEDVLR